MSSANSCEYFIVLYIVVGEADKIRVVVMGVEVVLLC